MTDIVPVKKPNLFQKGQSGNPAGRPKGSKNAISIIKLQLEGEMRARMRPNMAAVVDEMVRQAMPTKIVDPNTGVETILPGDKDMLKTLFGAWVSKSRASEDESPKEKIQIVIGKLDQVPAVNGKVFSQSNPNEE